MLRVAATMRVPERVETLGVSGGGMKGVASLGAVVALKKQGALRHLKTVVGTSAGALVAAALATNKASVHTLDGLSSVRYQPDIDLGRLMSSFGIDSGRHLERWIDVLLDGETYTFRDIRERFGMTLVICVTNLSERRPEYLSPDTTPDMPVRLALRMTCTIPLYFTTRRYEGRVYIDGAVSDNFPLEWAARTFGRHTALGIAFKPRDTNPGNSLHEYVSALLESSTRRHYNLDDPRVLQLDTGARSAFEFGMSARDMRRLYASGARQARAWIKKHA